MSFNLLTVSGSIGQKKFWRYWFLCGVANAITVGALVAAAVLAYGWAR